MVGTWWARGGHVASHPLDSRQYHLDSNGTDEESLRTHQDREVGSGAAVAQALQPGEKAVRQNDTHFAKWNSSLQRRPAIGLSNRRD